MSAPLVDEPPMRQALRLAESAVGLTEPNPRVGCVIVSADGQHLLGQGHTQAAGQAHAEVMALRDAAQSGRDVRGATAFVTLEPCSHHGRTPPCCDALIQAGLARVVVAVGDPNPQVNGQGVARLRAAGLQVDWGNDEDAAASRELNIGFFSRMSRGRPWVRLKMATSIDGRTALPDGRSQWLTGPVARADGHAWRRRAGVVLSGIGTVLADAPRLDVRLVPTARQPLRAVIDARAETPPDAPLLQVDGSPLLVFTAGAPAQRVARLLDAGAELIDLPGTDGRVDLQAVLAELHRRQTNELHLEAGARLSGAWLAAGLVDELLLYQAPVLVGPGRALAELPLLPDLTQASRWQRVDLSALGEDLRLRLRRRPD